MLVLNFKKVLDSYHTVTDDNFAGNIIMSLLREEIPNNIKDSNILDLEKFMLKGSGGQSKPALIPWVAIFNSSITKKAARGLYLVFLLKADMSGMYLSLNQGFTYFKEKYGDKDGKIKLRRVSQEIRNILNTLPKDSIKDIELCSKGRLGKGYEAGNIGAKYYSINNMPDDTDLIKDIKEYIIVYNELSEIIGSRTIEQFYDYMLIKEAGYEINEENEKRSVEIALNSMEDNIPMFSGEKKEKKKRIIDRAGKIIYPRNPKIAANVLKMMNYTCEIDEKHYSFTRKTNGKNYTESHHLIPINYQDEFPYSLDVEENIISLCSSCHNCLHYGVDGERIVLLKKLYNARSSLLKKAGIDVTLEELKKYYKIEKY